MAKEGKMISSLATDKQVGEKSIATNNHDSDGIMRAKSGKLPHEQFNDKMAKGLGC
jgi:hypothetical protein